MPSHILVCVYVIGLLLLAGILVTLVYSGIILKRKMLSHVEALKESQARLNRAELTAGFGNWEFHLSENMVHASEGARKIYGLDKTDWTIPEVQTIALPEYRPMLDAAMDALIRKKETYHVEFKIRRANDGEIRDIGSFAQYDPSRNVVFGVIHDITEHKHIEEKLRRSEERYRGILDNMEEAYYEVDLGGSFMFFNTAAAKALGYSEEEMLGMNYRQIADEVNTAKLFETFHRVFTTGETVRGFDWEIKDRHGRQRPVEASVSLIRDGRGAPAGFRGVVRDVTQRKQDEERLRRSEERYRGILDNMEEAYYEMDLKGNMTFINSAVKRSFGYSDEELHGLSYQTYVKKESLKNVRDAFSKVFTTGLPIKGFDCQIICKDGREIVVESSVSLMRDAEGCPVGFRGVTRDITWRIEAEERLMHSEERYRTIFENTGTATMLSADDTTILLANSNFEELTGYSKEEMEGKMSWTKFIDGSDIERVKSYHVQRRRNGNTAPVSYEARCRNRREELRYLLLTVAMIPGTKESVISCLDLTERNRAEEEIIKREKLQGVLEMAGAVCHELNQPLQVLMGAADLLRSDVQVDDPEQEQELLGSIQTGVEQIGVLTQKIMKITGYEVKDYLGGKSRIIDIDRSSSKKD